MNSLDRAFIAERLIDSLDPEIDEDVELAWQKEVQSRANELDTGKLKTIPWEEVKTQISKDLSVPN